MKEIENKEIYENSDEDVLFGTMDESDNDDEDNKTEKAKQSNNILSLWGGNQVLKNK